jgi:hypothetical protein
MVMGRPSDYVGSTSGVAQIADDILQHQSRQRWARSICSCRPGAHVGRHPIGASPWASGPAGASLKAFMPRWRDAFARVLAGEDVAKEEDFVLRHDGRATSPLTVASSGSTRRYPASGLADR